MPRIARANVCATVYNVILASPVKRETYCIILYLYLEEQNSYSIIICPSQKKLVDISHAEAAAAVATGWLAQAHAATIAPLPLK